VSSHVRNRAHFLSTLVLVVLESRKERELIVSSSRAESKVWALVG
jgi:hypothetical protein